MAAPVRDGRTPEELAAVEASEDRTTPAYVAPEGMVTFYRLTRKFVESAESIPDEAKQVMYYTLSIGHHTGVIDCFEPALACPRDLYDAVCALMPQGPARFKLEGIGRFGEIQIDKSHLGVLMPAVDEALASLGFRGSAKAGLDVADPQFGLHTREAAWLMQFRDLLLDVQGEAALYLTGRG